MKLDDLFTISKGKKPPVLFDEPFDGAVPFIKIEGIREAGNHQYCETSDSLVTCTESDVLIVWDGAYSGLAGFGLHGAIGSTIARLRPKSGQVFGPYAGRYLQSKFAEIQKYASGAAIPHVNGGHLRRLEIPLPPLDEQRRIAAVLDKADTLRRLRQESLQLTEKLRQSVFIDMFGDPMTNPKKWVEKQLGDLIVMGPQNGLYRPQSDYGTGYRILRIDGFYDGRLVDQGALRRVRLSLKEAEPYALQEGDIVINRVNSIEYIGKSALIPKLTEDTVFESNIMRLRVDSEQVIPEFLISLLQDRHIKAQIAGRAKKAVNQASINQKDVHSLIVFIPPIDLQFEFKKRIEAITGVMGGLQEQSGHWDSFFASLQQHAFHGEFDLSRVELVHEAESQAVAIVPGHSYNEGVYNRPGYFIAPPEIEEQLMALEDRLDTGPGDSIPWSEDYFKYRTLSQLLRPPFSFSDIWEKVEYDMEEANYETVKEKVFEYVAAGILEQQFDEKRKEIVFHPRT
ncbi:MAG: restriction endonuclease subunit S [Bacteroidetes bacterium]|nr:restriction endonuclease subunit S [Bacteroidota bacterium]